MMLLISWASPLWKVDTSPDPNTYWNVGMAMRHGAVLYRDVFDHKGPLLFLAVVPLTYVGRHPMTGFWLLQSACATAYATVCEHALEDGGLSRKKALFGTAFLCLVAYAAVPVAACTGGEFEAYALPMLAWTFTRCMGYARRRGLLPARDGFVMGIMLGVVLWCKFSTSGLFVGIAIWAVATHGARREWGRLCRLVAAVIGGVAVVSLIPVAYMALTGSWGDFYECYILTNLLGYRPASDAASILGGRHVAPIPAAILVMCGFRVFSAFSTLFLCADSLTHVRRDSSVALLCCASVVPAVVGECAGGFCFVYYSDVLEVFMGQSLLAFLRTVGKAGTRRPSLRVLLWSPFVFAAAIGIAEASMFWQALVAARTSDPTRVQERFAAEMGKDPDLLVAGNADDGFYALTGATPRVRDFTSTNARTDEYRRAIEGYLADGVTEWVVTIDERGGKTDVGENYRLVDETDGAYDGLSHPLCGATFRLYARIE